MNLHLPRVLEFCSELPGARVCVLWVLTTLFQLTAQDCAPPNPCVRLEPWLDGLSAGVSWSYSTFLGLAIGPARPCPLEADEPTPDCCHPRKE